MNNKKIVAYNKVVKQTYDETMSLLNEYGKAIIVRPTGFGKTFMLTKIANVYLNKHMEKEVLYVYPKEVIKNSVLEYIDGTPEHKIRAEILQRNGRELKPLIGVEQATRVRFVSHSMFRKVISSADDVKLKNEASKYSLVIYDEAHLLGGEKVFKCCKIFNKYLIEKGGNFVGGTATPDRMDEVDVISEIFDKKVTSYYDLVDAVEDGLIQKPYYIYSMTMNRKQLNEECEEKTKKYRDGVLNREKIEIALSKLVNAPDIIREAIERKVRDKSFMKFMCFYNTIESMEQGRRLMISNFANAFPDMKIKTLSVASKKSNNGSESVRIENSKGEKIEVALDEADEKLSQLMGMARENNTIQLIFCVDMLNLGYHVDDITGIVMMRKTRSDIVYRQQLGRVLNVMSDKQAIIFDFVSNIEIRPLVALGKIESNDNTSTTIVRNKSNNTGVFELQDNVATFNKIMRRFESDISPERMAMAMRDYCNKDLRAQGLTVDIVCTLYEIHNMRMFIETLKKKGIEVVRNSQG